MTAEELEAIKIREFLSTLTEEDIIDSFYLRDMDFATCEINDVVDSTWMLFLEYQYLKIQVDYYDHLPFLSSSLFKEVLMLKDYYEKKKDIVKKILSCEELEELVIEKAFSDYLEDDNKMRIRS